MSGLAYSTLACPAWSLEQAVEAALQHGYSGLELRLIDGEMIDPGIGRAERRRVDDLLTGAGLPVVALDTSIRLAADDPARTIADLHAFLELAAEWRAPLVRVFGGVGSRSRDDMASLLAAAAPEAERLGVGIAVETHDALSSAADLADLLARVESPAVGALWDVLHTYRMGEEPEQAARSLASRMLHVHVKDGRQRPDEAAWDLVLLGHGEVPLARSLQALHDGGYDGWISVEWEKKWHPEIPEPEVALPQHAAELTRLLSRTLPPLDG